MITKIAAPGRYDVAIGDLYVAKVTLVPAGLSSSDPLREDHDDRSINVPCSSGSIWCDVHLRDGGALAANAVFGADDVVVRCDTIEVMEANRRQGIARRLYEIASCVFEGPVVRSDKLSADARDFWSERKSIKAG